ncbi:ABC transporter permease [Aureibacillus halotolerans]|uniref:Putative aldouronate transport system permease protein n=1 Tax=Aureibacillus halotolerans TaxID=1508390 RepID=A0A4R6UA28_9BACI|nr:ABC transporter permease subunit [Aureibacillus halotolerans]TDQ42692.1 putative aldouronate transport system permease protein [Aureibacillus halotolerans]
MAKAKSQLDQQAILAQIEANRSGWKETKKRLKKSAGLYVILLLPIIYFGIWHYWPMYGVQIAFKDFLPGSGIWGSPWVGFEHFERFFNAYYFERLIRNTLAISAYGLIVGVPLPIILALMLNELRNKKLRNIVQTISYAPHFISVVVIVGMLLFFISPTSGVVNGVIEMWGGERIDFLADPNNFWHLFTWSGIWQSIGWSSLIYTAAMAGVPPEQYEAAYIDGAGKFRRIWHITLPGIRPTIVILAILAVGGIMSVGFEKVLLMQTGSNLETSEVISTYMYKSGILNAQYSFSAAVGLFNNIINFALLIVVNAIARKVGETSLW